MVVFGTCLVMGYVAKICSHRLYLKASLVVFEVDKGILILVYRCDFNTCVVRLYIDKNIYVCVCIKLKCVLLFLTLLHSKVPKLHFHRDIFWGSFHHWLIYNLSICLLSYRVGMTRGALYGIDTSLTYLKLQ